MPDLFSEKQRVKIQKTLVKKYLEKAIARSQEKSQMYTRFGLKTQPREPESRENGIRYSGPHCHSHK